MTANELRRNDRVLAAALLVGVAFLVWDLYRSIRLGVSTTGWWAYLAGPIFAHKISEVLLLAMWAPVVWVVNYERAGSYPKRLPPDRYLQLLSALLMLAPLQIVLATYAWTVVNLGTSPLTTDFKPLTVREDGWVWRYYLGALIVAGVSFVPYASRKTRTLAETLAVRAG